MGCFDHQSYDFREGVWILRDKYFIFGINRLGKKKLVTTLFFFGKRFASHFDKDGWSKKNTFPKWW